MPPPSHGWHWRLSLACGHLARRPCRQKNAGGSWVNCGPPKRVRCDACGWRPPLEAIPTRPALPLDTTTSRAPFVPGHQVLHVNGVDIDTSGLLDHGSLLRNGPCEHTDDVGPCVACTRAAVDEERARLSLRGAPPEPPGPVSDEARALAERAAAAPTAAPVPIAPTPTATGCSPIAPVFF